MFIPFCDFVQAAEKEVKAEVSGILREGKAASSELAAAEAAAEKAVSRHSKASGWRQQLGWQDIKCCRMLGCNMCPCVCGLRTRRRVYAATCMMPVTYLMQELAQHPTQPSD